MKKNIIYILFFILSSNLFAQTNVSEINKSKPCMPVEDIPVADLGYKNGEKLTYVLSYKWGGISTDVGEANVHLEAIKYNGVDVFHAKAWGKTYKFYDRFFRVRDFYESKFYAKNCRPIYFHRNIEEGKYRIKNHYYFNDKTCDINASIQKMNIKQIDTILPGRICTFDILTLFYFARNIDFDSLERGIKQPISLAIDEEIYELYFKYIGREEKKIEGLGKFRTMKFVTVLVAGEVFDGENEMTIWITDDKNKIPLMFESPVIVGNVQGVLKDFTNLKFPLSSKIKK